MSGAIDMTTIRTLIAASVAIGSFTADLAAQAIVQPRHVIDGGGGRGASVNFSVRQVFGQPLAGKGAGGALTLTGGFLGSAPGGGQAMVTVPFGVAAGWNLLSVPVEAMDLRKTSLYPTAVSNAFSFTTQYVARDTLETGVGYWLKFGRDETVGMVGYPRDLDSVQVVAGWNLVGALSTPVAVTAVGSIPPGMVLSNFFGFEGSYVATDSLVPGRGYWVKTGGAGLLILASSPGRAVPTTRVRIVPDGELPPAPPSGAEDPGWNGLPKVHALHQNYPNPFNPETEIRFDLPSDGDVVLRIYSILGEEVATLVDGPKAAGFWSVRFDGGRLASGVYFCRLTAGSYGAVMKMMVVR